MCRTDHLAEHPRPAGPTCGLWPVPSGLGSSGLSQSPELPLTKCVSPTRTREGGQSGPYGAESAGEDRPRAQERGAGSEVQGRHHGACGCPGHPEPCACAVDVVCSHLRTRRLGLGEGDSLWQARLPHPMMNRSEESWEPRAVGVEGSGRLRLRMVCPASGSAALLSGRPAGLPLPPGQEAQHPVSREASCWSERPGWGGASHPARWPRA